MSDTEFSINRFFQPVALTQPGFSTHTDTSAESGTSAHATSASVEPDAFVGTAVFFSRVTTSFDKESVKPINEMEDAVAKEDLVAVPPLIAT